jgi:hypothetical protein
MILAVQGSHNFDQYEIFLNGIFRSLKNMSDDDSEILIYSAGPRRVNGMVMEFANVSERSLKGRGIKIKVRKVPPSWLEENIVDVDYLAYFSKPKEPESRLVKVAEAKDIPIGVYRY